jgi:DNA-binding CsgD family transcriptional regulator
MPGEVARRLTERLLQPSLTPREIEVLRLMARGMRDKKIAADLGVSEASKTSAPKRFSKIRYRLGT